MEASPTPHPLLRIGTRRSNLAMVQAEGIRDCLQKIAPDRSYEIQALRTQGDRDQLTALYNFGAKNLWTTELEEKLKSGELDVIVHCLKDMPTSLPDFCELAAIPPRDDPRDALIVKAGLPYTNLQSLPEGAVVGTSSVRRSAQLRRLYPHLRFANLRGNVETRLAKVDDPDSEYTCMVMSAAGLHRVGLDYRINQYLGSKDGGILHAVGQGALGLEIRKGDRKMQELLGQLADQNSTLACLAERSLMKTLEGGCSVPIGVETKWVSSEDLSMHAIVVSLDGTESVEDTIVLKVQTADEATALGKELASRMVNAGAGEILHSINANRPPKD
ncbi:porphobilinogen deaminase, dipyromethane cofactor binding domain-containing protein [Aspergillus pseudonomiae]|uniref:Porphobilinogen deaminase n=1 Tax=Aspergillus pseudonomiae TaxID=1506151 RepID=A0A5N7DTI3_9EURO|nr:porphobilinogen deaminase, dipyromethane cofactor binding domain-containing protein [Aspergillus pseudonomiae]KAB8263216.1 porphobilinogen deaminase, dipyromethane cofactor binding domain-containing protein [Aspergillus pseudonomiae]KAE8409752.1 porphobilinogen deaminase, dipyromethane cofactor binding domain-containing protein [Aspergillus pseudonomiae]